MGMLKQHASIRLQQRAISRERLDLLLIYGQRTRSNGADIVYLNRSSRHALERDVGRKEYAKLAGKLRIYAVVGDDGSVITAGHRFKRIPRP